LAFLLRLPLRNPDRLVPDIGSSSRALCLLSGLFPHPFRGTPLGIRFGLFYDPTATWCWFDAGEEGLFGPPLSLGCQRPAELLNLPNPESRHDRDCAVARIIDLVGRRERDLAVQKIDRQFDRPDIPGPNRDCQSFFRPFYRSGFVCHDLIMPDSES